MVISFFIILIFASCAGEQTLIENRDGKLYLNRDLTDIIKQYRDENYNDENTIGAINLVFNDSDKSAFIGFNFNVSNLYRCPPTNYLFSKDEFILIYSNNLKLPMIELENVVSVSKKYLNDDMIAKKSIIIEDSDTLSGHVLVNPTITGRSIIWKIDLENDKIAVNKNPASEPSLNCDFENDPQPRIID